MEYQIAFVLEGTGEFEIVESFEATSDAEANSYAETHYPDDDWYVLRDGDNING